MNRIRLAALALAFVPVAMPVLGGEVTLTISDADQKNWAVTPSLFEQCIVAAALHGDVNGCRAIGSFLTAFAGVVASAPPKVAPPAAAVTPTTPPAPPPP